MEEKHTHHIYYKDTIFLSVLDGETDGCFCPIGMSRTSAGVDVSATVAVHQKHSWFRFLILPMDDPNTGAVRPPPIMIPTSHNDPTKQVTHVEAPKNRVVSYGDVVTLRHIETGSYLSISNNDPSLNDPGNIQATFTKAVPDRSCWLRILPRYRVRVEGQQVLPSDEIAFESFEDKLWLHTSSECVDPEQKVYEVNFSSSNQRIGYIITLYDPTGDDRSVLQDPSQRRRIISAQFLKLFHKEECGFVTVQASGSANASVSSPRRPHGKNVFVEKLLGGELSKHKGVHIECIFEIESGDSTMKGTIIALDRPVRFKHLCSRQYFCARKDGDNVSLTLESDPSLPGTRFLLESAGNDQENNAARVYGMYRIRSELYPTCWIVTNRHSTIVLAEGFNFRDALELCTVAFEDVVVYCSNLAPGFQEYYRAWIEGCEDPKEQTLRDYLVLLDRALSYLKNAKDHATLTLRRDSMVALDLHSWIVTCIGAPFDSGKHHIDSLAPKGLHTLGVHTKLLIEICKISFELLTLIIERTPHASLLTLSITNIARFLAYDVGAQNALLEILRDNEFLALQMEAENVNQFFEFIRRRGRLPVYAQFFCQLLICKGRANRRMQDLVLNGLRDNISILLRTRKSGDRVEVLLPPVHLTRPDDLFPPFSANPNDIPPGWIWTALSQFVMFQEYRELRLFHEATVQLLAYLCADSNKNGMDFARAFLVDVSTPLIVLTQEIPSFTMKAAYATLTKFCLLETEPAPCRSIKIASKLRGDKEHQGEITQRVRMTTLQQMDTLRNMKMEDEDINLYLLSLISLCESFVQRGTQEADKEIVKTVLFILDPKSDECNESTHARTVDLPSRRAANQVKTTICKLLMVVLEKQADAFATELIRTREVTNDKILTMCKPQLPGSPSPRYVIDVLMSITKYQYPPLVFESLQLLLNMFCLHWVVHDQLSEITLLETDKDMENHNLLMSTHNTLRVSLCLSDFNSEQMHDVQNALYTMTQLMTQSQNNQQLVHTIGTINLIETFYIMRNRAASAKKCSAILNLCLQFVAAYVSDIPHHQEQCAPMIAHFTRQTDYINQGVLFNCLTSILKNNPTTIKQCVDESFLLFVVTQCVRGHEVSALDLLLSVLVVQGHLMLNNLEAVIKILQGRKDLAKEFYLYCYRDIDLFELEKLVTDDDFNKNPNGKMNYFIKLLKFMSLALHCGFDVPVGCKDAAKEFLREKFPLYYRSAFCSLLAQYVDHQETYHIVCETYKEFSLITQVHRDMKILETVPSSDYVLNAASLLSVLLSKRPRPCAISEWTPIVQTLIQVLSKYNFTHLSKHELTAMIRHCDSIVHQLNNNLDEKSQIVFNGQDLVEQALTNKDETLTSIQELTEEYNKKLEDGNFIPLFRLRKMRDEEERAIVDNVEILADVLARNFPEVNHSLTSSVTAKLLQVIEFSIPVEDSDDDESDVDDEEGVAYVGATLKDVQDKLDDKHVTDMLLLLGESENKDVRHNSIALGIAMLADMNVKVQTSAINYFYRSTLEGLMIRFRQILQDGMSILRSCTTDFTEFEEVGNTLESEILPLLKFMQSLCEGHNLALQDYLRSQPDNVVSVDLVREVVFFVRQIFKHLNSHTFPTALQGLDTLTELCQGPCQKNQEVLVEYNMAWVVRDLLDPVKRPTFESEEDKASFTETLEKGITMLLSMTEGISMSSNVPERLFDKGMFEELIQRMNETWIDGFITKANVAKGKMWKDVSRETPTFDEPLPEEPENEMEDELALGYMIFTFLASVARYDKSNQLRHLLEKQMSYKYFHDHTGQIEIARAGQLERVFFRIPRACAYLQEQTKEEVQVQVKRDTAAVKIQDFFARWDDLISETEIYYKSSKSTMLRVFIDKGSYLADVSLLLSIVISLFLMITMDHKNPRENEFMDTTGYGTFRGMAIFQIFMELWLYFGWLALRGKVLIGQYIAACLQELNLVKEKDKQKYGVLYQRYYVYMQWNKELIQNSSHKARYVNRLTKIYRSIFILLQNEEFYVSSLFAAAAPMGLLTHPIFFSVQIFRVIQRSDSLQNVIKAVTLKWADLLTTSALGAVVVFLFSMVSFYYFDDKYYDVNRNPDLGEGFVCQSLARCFALNVIYGLRQGGGIGDVLQAPNWQDSMDTIASRLIFDFLFWVIMIIIFLNIIFGIILDTFADLRDKKQDRDKDKRTLCFICGVEAFEFDKYSGGFLNHYHEDHNMWKYLAYRHFILHYKDRTEYTGQESYVDLMCLRKDLSFFPQEKAMCLLTFSETDSLEEENREKRIEAGVMALLKSVEAQHDRESKRRRKLMLEAAKQKALLSDSSNAFLNSSQALNGSALFNGDPLSPLVGHETHKVNFEDARSAISGVSQLHVLDPELELSVGSTEAGPERAQAVTMMQASSRMSQKKRDELLIEMLRLCKETSGKIDQVRK